MLQCSRLIPADTRYIGPHAAAQWKRDAYLTSWAIRGWLMMPTLCLLFVLCFIEVPLWCTPSQLPKWHLDPDPWARRPVQTARRCTLVLVLSESLPYATAANVLRSAPVLQQSAERRDSG